MEYFYFKIISLFLTIQIGIQLAFQKAQFIITNNRFVPEVLYEVDLYSLACIFF